jgi:hypothetical protein
MHITTGRIAVSLVIVVGLASALGMVQPTKDAPSHAAVPASDARLDVERVLDALHEAASRAARDEYFALFAPEAVFIGTDITERWTLAEFRAYAEPIFAQGRGWTYVPSKRHVTLSRSGDVAWFDEIVVNQTYGECRGTGVLTKHDGAWRIEQYHLTLPVPNDMIKDVAARIIEQAKAREAKDRR